MSCATRQPERFNTVLSPPITYAKMVGVGVKMGKHENISMPSVQRQTPNACRSCVSACIHGSNGTTRIDRHHTVTRHRQSSPSGMHPSVGSVNVTSDPHSLEMAHDNGAYNMYILRPLMLAGYRIEHIATNAPERLKSMARC